MNQTPNSLLSQNMNSRGGGGTTSGTVDIKMNNKLMPQKSTSPSVEGGGVSRRHHHEGSKMAT